MSLTYCQGNCGDSTSMYAPRAPGSLRGRCSEMQRAVGVGWGVGCTQLQKQGREGQNQEGEKEAAMTC